MNKSIIYVVIAIIIRIDANAQTSFPSFNDPCFGLNVGRYKSLFHYFEYLPETDKPNNLTVLNSTEYYPKSTDYDASFVKYGYDTIFYRILYAVGNNPFDEFPLSVEFTPLKIDTLEDDNIVASPLLFPPGTYKFYLGFQAYKHPSVNIYFNNVLLKTNLTPTVNPFNYDRSTQTVFLKIDGIGGFIDTVTITGNNFSSVKLKVEFNQLTTGTLEELKLFHWALIPLQPVASLLGVSTIDLGNKLYFNVSSM